MTRRTVLSLAGLAALGVTVPACRRMFWEILLSPSATPVLSPVSSANPFTATGKSLVAVVHGDDVVRMVRRALDLLGGIGRLGLSGEAVLVKPNVVSGEPSPATTDPRVIKVVVDLCRQAGASSASVGDMSAVLALPTRPNLVRTGIARAAEEAGATLMAFDEGHWVEMRPAGAEWATTVFLARAVHEAPRLISVPVIKAHRNATFSCALKNSVGCVHGKNKPWVYGSDGWEPAVAELNLAVRPHLYVVDGLRSMVAGGPWSGEVAATDLILASGDPVALDVVALALLKSFGRAERIAGQEVWDNRQIRRAIALGLGVPEPGAVELVTDDLSRQGDQFQRLVARIRGIASLRA